MSLCTFGKQVSHVVYVRDHSTQIPGHWCYMANRPWEDTTRSWGCSSIGRVLAQHTWDHGFALQGYVNLVWWHACDLNNQKEEAGGSEVQGQPQQHETLQKEGRRKWTKEQITTCQLSPSKNPSCVGPGNSIKKHFPFQISYPGWAQISTKIISWQIKSTSSQESKCVSSEA